MILARRRPLPQAVVTAVSLVHPTRPNGSLCSAQMRLRDRASSACARPYIEHMIIPVIHVCGLPAVACRCATGCPITVYALRRGFNRAHGDPPQVIALPEVSPGPVFPRNNTSNLLNARPSAQGRHLFSPLAGAGADGQGLRIQKERNGLYLAMRACRRKAAESRLHDMTGEGRWAIKHEYTEERPGVRTDSSAMCGPAEPEDERRGAGQRKGDKTVDARVDYSHMAHHTGGCHPRRAAFSTWNMTRRMRRPGPAQRRTCCFLDDAGGHRCMPLRAQGRRRAGKLHGYVDSRLGARRDDELEVDAQAQGRSSGRLCQLERDR